LNVVQLIEQEIDLSTAEIVENHELLDQLDHKIELSGDNGTEIIEAA